MCDLINLADNIYLPIKKGLCPWIWFIRGLRQEE